jgi:hypothetical protein
LSGRPSRLAFLGAALALLLCSACQVTIALAVDSRADGSGTIRTGVGLDADALRQVPDFAQQLRVDDLKRAGWTVVGPRKEGDGRTWVRASKPFANPASARRTVSEVNGPNGPFRDFRLSRTHSFLRTKTSFAGMVDLRGASALADQRLLQQLGATGADTTALQQQADALVNHSFRIEVVAHLPGSVSSNAPTAVSGGALWHPKIGEHVRLTATSTAWNLRPVIFGAIALLAALAALLVWRRGRRAGRSEER